jgi:hypothetical protein
MKIHSRVQFPTRRHAGLREVDARLGGRRARTTPGAMSWTSLDRLVRSGTSFSPASQSNSSRRYPRHVPVAFIQMSFVVNEGPDMALNQCHTEVPVQFSRLAA